MADVSKIDEAAAPILRQSGDPVVTRERIVAARRDNGRERQFPAWNRIPACRPQRIDSR